MELFKLCLQGAWTALNAPISVLGYEVTFWQVFVFTLIGGLVAWGVGKIIFG